MCAKRSSLLPFNNDEIYWTSRSALQKKDALSVRVASLPKLPANLS
jgi:hypothetical protein